MHCHHWCDSDFRWPKWFQGIDDRSSSATVSWAPQYTWTVY